jgi:diguanylate cyclase (GGDEF)-like protein
MFSSYAQLAHTLLNDVSGVCLLDGKLRSCGQTGASEPEPIARSLRALGWNDSEPRAPVALAQGQGQYLTAVPLLQDDGVLLGVFCVQRALGSSAAPSAKEAASDAARLKPLLECVQRELTAARPTSQRLYNLTARTAELEWLFNVTSKLNGAPDDRRILEELLSASVERLESAFGILLVPDKRICIERNVSGSAALRSACEKIQQHLITWAQRQNRPLIINGKSAARAAPNTARCKILSVPVARDNGPVIGVLAFFNPAEAADFATRHVFLAQHLGRQTAAIIETQFDLMTGLHTRDGLEQMYRRLPAESEANCSVIYIDVDHMSVVNELHGFELGNELIVRIADLMAPPLLPAAALAARIAGDRFAIILPDSSTGAAAAIAAQVQSAATRLIIGPAQEVVEVSISCGVAALVAMPQGLARALAAAELACKSAKKHGRNRVEQYACEDESMMRRHEDVIAVGQLRGAIKSDRLLLYAQRIVPLQKREAPEGYEILLRLRGPDENIIAPGSLINAAQRYQLLPTVDRWVSERALQMLTPYRGMLRARSISVSINLSGQSIGDEAFIARFTDQLQAANLPRGSIIVEITEQAAVTNLARANDMVKRLNAMGCRLALDDFGTGTNSLTNLKSLDVARVKIDGSFVRDILTNQRSRATVRAVVELARGFGIDTVAEFVETKGVANAVRELGVDYAQGYAFSIPEPLRDVLERLNQDESRLLHGLAMEF